MLYTLTFNCFQEDSSLVPANPDSEINIKFQLFYFNQETSTWVQKGSDFNVSDKSPTLEGEILTYINTNSALTDQQVSDYVKNIYINTENKFTNFNTDGDIYTNNYTSRAAFLSLGACK